jgi:hypothetical protein
VIQGSLDPASRAPDRFRSSSDVAVGRVHAAALVPKGADDDIATLSVPRFAEPGTWAVRLYLADCAGNVREFGAA